jgi:hypothetical protein
MSGTCRLLSLRVAADYALRRDKSTQISIAIHSQTDRFLIKTDGFSSKVLYTESLTKIVIDKHKSRSISSIRRR